MAPSRAFSFPLSRCEEEEATTKSRERPFAVADSDAVLLTECEAFRCIRDLLGCRKEDGEDGGGGNAFCHAHSDVTDAERGAWLLQRDITFALVFPIIEVYRHATELALSMLGNRDVLDLELVFRGEARGAFSWLQCFITVENEWCTAEGCPACVVSHVLQSEPTIRMIITACRLASSIRRPNELEDPHDIPIFDFWVTSLAHALQEDPFYGRDSWQTFGDRAKGLERGIYAMAQQCCDLERLLNPTNSNSESDCTPPASPAVSGRMKRSADHRKMAGKMASVREEDRWMQKIILGCWTTLLADAKQQQAPKTAGKKDAGGPLRPPSALRSPSL